MNATTTHAINHAGLSYLPTEVQTLTEHIASAHASNQQAHNEILSRSTEMQKWSQEVVDRLVVVVKNMDEANNANKAENQRLTQEHEAMKTRYESLYSENEALKSQEELFKAQHRTFKAQLETLRSEHELVKQQNVSLSASQGLETQRLKEKEEEIQRLHAALARSDLELERLKENVGNLWAMATGTGSSCQPTAGTVDTLKRKQDAAEELSRTKRAKTVLLPHTTQHESQTETHPLPNRPCSDHHPLPLPPRVVSPPNHIANSKPDLLSRLTDPVRAHFTIASSSQNSRPDGSTLLNRITFQDRLNAHESSNAVHASQQQPASLGSSAFSENASSHSRAAGRPSISRSSSQYSCSYPGASLPELLLPPASTESQAVVREDTRRTETPAGATRVKEEQTDELPLSAATTLTTSDVSDTLRNGEGRSESGGKWRCAFSKRDAPVNPQSQQSRPLSTSLPSLLDLVLYLPGLRDHMIHEGHDLLVVQSPAPPAEGAPSL